MSFLARLFSLDSLSFAEEGIELSLARPLPAWGWLLISVLAVALAVWSYARLSGSRPGRMALAGVRALVLFLLVVIVAGPQLVRRNERIERDWVLVLADRSASMTIADVNDPGGRTARDDYLRRIIQQSMPVWNTLDNDRELVWLGFDSGAFELPIERDGTSLTDVDLGDPDGRRTSLGRALEQALGRAAARPVSGVVVLSDGRSIDEPARSTLRRLENERIPVFVLPVGSPDPIVDLAIRRVEAPALAFVDDTVVVHVEVDRLGAVDPHLLTRARAELVDADGSVLDQVTLPEQWAGESERIALSTRSSEAGEAEWSVRLVLDQPDLVSENNARPLRVDLVDRPVRVVYFDGYPRWEQRYVKTLLLREDSMSSSSLILAADKRYLQEGDEILESIPRSPEEWAGIDVVVIGDVRSELFSDEQLMQLREHVALRGAGLLWIAGPGAVPGNWRQTPLADLLPFTGEAAPRRWFEAITMHRAEAGERLGVLQLSDDSVVGWPERLSRPETGWSQLWWAQNINVEDVKPTAEILAWGVPVSEQRLGNVDPRRDGSPLVMSMRYGAGRVIYVATDEIWRWRYGRGGALVERFWLPLIRLQARESLARSGQAALLNVTPTRATVDQPVRIALKLVDQSLMDARPRSVVVTARRTDASGQTAEIPITLGPEGDADVYQTFATTWLATEPGEYLIAADDPLLIDLGLEARVEVALPDSELRRPETDHVLLASLAEETGGAVLAPNELDALPNLLPRREIRIAATPDIETLWDKPIVLILLMLLLTAEWIGRKLLHLA